MRLQRYTALLVLLLLLLACSDINFRSTTGNNTDASSQEDKTTVVASWESDDPEADLTICTTGDPAGNQKIANQKIYLDVLHVNMEEIILNDPMVTLDGQMCAYRFTLDYGRPISQQGMATGEILFTAGDLVAHYGFQFNNGKTVWDTLVENTDTHASLRSDNLDDFGLSVVDSKIVITIPCYAVPRADDQTAWQITTFNHDANGNRQYCDEVSNSGSSLPTPQVYWHGTETITIADLSDDVMDLTNKSSKLHLPSVDILSLHTSLAPRETPVMLTMGEFPPDADISEWAAVVRMNMSLVGPGQLICGRDENGQEGLIDPQSLAFKPDNGLATFQTDGVNVGCTFAPPALSLTGCVAVSGDFYLTDTKTHIKYKDRVNSVILCYQQP